MQQINVYRLITAHVRKDRDECNVFRDLSRWFSALVLPITRQDLGWGGESRGDRNYLETVENY